MTTAASINLHAMPMNFDEWAKICSGLTASQEGTLLRATRVAWQAGHRGAPAASLPNDDAALGRMLGGREHLDVVRRLFVPDESDPTILVWRWLANAYAEALARYERRKLAGVESGQTRRRRAKERSGADRGAEQCSSNARTMREQPKPNPVGVGSSNQPPTGGAETDPAMGGRSIPPDPVPEHAGADVPEERVAAWAAAHPEELAQLERDADAAMDHLNAEWRALPRRFGRDVRDHQLRELVARRIRARDALASHLGHAGGPHA